MSLIDPGIYSRSCAPCAAAKRSCDHARPACGRCVRMGIAGQCTPAPDKRRLRAPKAAASTASHPSSSSPVLDAAATTVSLRLPLLRGPLATLHELVLRSLSSALADDRLIMTAIPAVPLAVPLDVLQYHATNQRVLSRALLPSSASGDLHEYRAAQATFEEATRSMIARSSVPTIRIVYIMPEEFDLSCQTLLLPEIVFANASWLFSVGMRHFINWDMLIAGSGGGAAPTYPSIPAALCAPALRLMVALRMFLPASMLTCSRTQLMRAMTHGSDADVVACFVDGVVLTPPPNVLQRPTNFVAPSFREAYFASFAQALLCGQSARHILTELEFTARRLMASQVSQLGDASAGLLEHQDVAALVRAQPSVLSVLATAAAWRVYRMRADETMQLSFNGVGLLSSVTVSFHNAVVIPPDTTTALLSDGAIPRDEIAATTNDDDAEDMALTALARDMRMSAAIQVMQERVQVISKQSRSKVDVAAAAAVSGKLEHASVAENALVAVALTLPIDHNAARSDSPFSMVDELAHERASTVSHGTNCSGMCHRDDEQAADVVHVHLAKCGASGDPATSLRSLLKRSSDH